MPPASSSAKEQSSSTAASIRNRRAFSGSGQTISQHTRDRLKTMIASKKQKQRLHSSGSSGSATNIAASSASNLTWMPPSAGCSETNLAHPNAQSSSASAGTANAHFEPYPLPSPTMHNPALMSEYQLRKVNSEPNLKMRIRARLLNKSPVVHMPSAAANPHPYSNNHRPLQR